MRIIPEAVVIGVIAGLLAALLLCGHHRATVEEPNAYKAWVKLTGNPKSLSFEEWRDLVNATKKSEPTPIFIYQQ